MTEIKKRWMMMPVVVVGLVFLVPIMGRAYTNQSLQDTRISAWQTFFYRDTVEIELEKDIEINGMVDSSCGVKVSIESFEDKGMIRKGESQVVYSSSKGEEVVGKIYADTIFSILSDEGERTKIHSGYLIGYVDSSVILESVAAEKKAQEICPEFLISNTPTVRIKIEPNEESETLCFMEQRVPYDIINEENEFYEVDIGDNVTGYISTTAIDKVREIHFGRSLIYLTNPQIPYVKEKVTEEERTLLAAIVFCEARGEIFEGQIAVASVVMNRVHSELFPNTIEEVIYEDNQFEPVQLNHFDEVLKNTKEISTSCYEAADVVIQGGNNIGEALYFRTGKIGTVIGSHGFY